MLILIESQQLHHQIHVIENYRINHKTELKKGRERERKREKERKRERERRERRERKREKEREREREKEKERRVNKKVREKSIKRRNISPFLPQLIVPM